MRWPWRREARAEPAQGIRSERTERAYQAGAIVNPWGAFPATFPAGVAAVEACVLAYRRALEAAELDGPAWAVDAVRPVLGDIADDAIRTGEYLGFLAFESGRLRLDPARIAFIDGARPDPLSWRYDLTVETPTSTLSRRVMGTEVVHVTWATERGRPWRGVSPMHRSSRTRNLLDGIERAMALEARSVNARLLKMVQGTLLPPRGESEWSLQADVSDGAVVEMPPVYEGIIEMRPKLDGPMVEAHLTVTRLIAAAHGVPVQLVLPSQADGTAQRESYRRWYVSSLRPFARRIEGELRRKVHPTIRIELEALRAMDMQGSARALKSLTDAGMDVAQASAVVGLME